jgi:3-methyladenine DNA glycosylase AlkD
MKLVKAQSHSEKRKGAQSSPAKTSASTVSDEPLERQVESALQWLKRHSSAATREGMSRFAIPGDRAFGVSVRDIKMLGKQLGRNHSLATNLWDTGVYEARMLASLVGDPEALTASEMERWCKDFDNWAICDSVCFNLFDKSRYAWAKMKLWTHRREEFEKRAGFALLWTLSIHDKAATNQPFLDEGLALIEREAADERHFVKKAVNMALRAVGKRNRELHEAAVETAKRLAASENAAARWVGSDAVRELTSASVAKRIRSKGPKGLSPR